MSDKWIDNAILKPELNFQYPGLPDRSIPILLWPVHGAVREGYMTRSKSGSRLYWKTANGSICDPTHWRPLPEPPK